MGESGRELPLAVKGRLEKGNAVDKGRAEDVGGGWWGRSNHPSPAEAARQPLASPCHKVIGPVLAATALNLEDLGDDAAATGKMVLDGCALGLQAETRLPLSIR